MQTNLVYIHLKITLFKNKNNKKINDEQTSVRTFFSLYRKRIAFVFGCELKLKTN